MSETLLQVRDLATWFGNRDAPVRAVDGVSFDIRRGETFALLGESGSGKSITALSLMQLVPGARIVSGQVLFDGRDLLTLSEMQMRSVRGNHIGMIFQEPMTALNPVLTAGDQIDEVLRQHTKLGRAARRARVLELLDAVGIPDPAHRYGEYPHQLSGGMKQRVMIATALAGEPELLIADEPTTAVDVTIQAQVLELLRKIQRDTGMAILMITHDLGVVAETADRVAVMYAGQIVEQADADAFFAAPQHPYSQKLFASLPDRNKREQHLAVIQGSVPPLNRPFVGCRFADRCDYAWHICREVAPPWVPRPGREGDGVRCHLADPATRAQAPAPAVAAGGAPGVRRAAAGSDQRLLEVRDLKVHFPVQKGLFKRTVGHVKAVDGVDLDIAPGRTLALVGESGSGKTTAGKAILQFIRPTGGTVRFAGEDLGRLGPAALRRRRADLQFIFQDPFASLNPRMLVGNIMEEGMLAQGLGGDEQERAARVADLLERVGLPRDARSRYPHEFSGGQRQRICIARALTVDPKLIVCDEPTSALDVSVQAQILNLLIDLQQQLALSYLFITHNLSVVEYMAHEVAVMYLGRIVERGPVEQVLQHPRHPYTQALLSAVPVVDRERKREIIRLAGDLPSPRHPPRGCHFHPRCPQAMPQCRDSYPAPVTFGARHSVSCHLYPSGERRKDEALAADKASN